MSIAVSKLVLIDGEQVNITCEGVTAREAFDACDAAAEELGAAAPPTEAVTGKKRGRRTKAEMEAARAAAAQTGGAPPDPTLPGILPEPARAFAPPMTAAQAESVARVPQQSDWPLGSERAASFTDAPPDPQGPKTVAFDAAPPFEIPGPPEPAAPPVDERSELCERIVATLNATKGLTPEWEAYIDANYVKACAGRNLMTADADALRGILVSVEDYHARCKDAVAKRAK